VLLWRQIDEQVPYQDLLLELPLKTIYAYTTLELVLELSFTLMAHEDMPYSLESLHAHETEHRTHFVPADSEQW
jgi:hypothetical protein